MPAPRIVLFQGSFALVTMEPFAEFLIAMGYPPDRIRHPRDGGHSSGSFTESRQIAGTLAWYYESEGVRPLVIGHSQGGMLAIRVLHELAGAFGDAIPVWDPVTDAPPPRTAIVDPLTGDPRPVVGLRLPYVAAIATGKLRARPARPVGDAREAPRDPGQRRGVHRVCHRMGPRRGPVPALRPVSRDGVRDRAQRDPPGDVHAHRVAARPFISRTDPVTRAWIEAYVPVDDAALRTTPPSTPPTSFTPPTSGTA